MFHDHDFDDDGLQEFASVMLSPPRIPCSPEATQATETSNFDANVDLNSYWRNEGQLEKDFSSYEEFQHEELKDEKGSQNAIDLDPITERVERLVRQQIQLNNTPISVKALAELGMFSDSVIRDRLDRLVKVNRLCMNKGSGRLPTTYFLPDSKPEDLPQSTQETLGISDAVEKLLKQNAKKRAEVEKQIKQLQEKMELLMRDEAAMLQTLEAAQRYGSL